ncbi:MAG: bifunctional diaminohydroxyphosphoribosylaminopyrimidine deaminase/5-amino-6-(5-phosphoribosylamino)uracil reductase RibD [Deltaproteobacteria bacterium]|nr:bifunctional diaminohydroxyphosphoribosylaminopyrimidine deaminase/5-amino-6-(5-phosphoribosylamino)uracil reductase RibD [Deltaproteobacteria bacterium]
MKSDEDIKYMQLAIDQAKRGRGRTSPNPCVGAVIVRDGIVAGHGYHHRAGSPHAEINALADAGESCTGATIYVTLEPCNHTGRTPPCSRAVLAAGLKRVVIGMADPNPVAGGGADFLRVQGLDVIMGVLEDECRRLNYPFLKHSSTELPWVVMKAGMSLDGMISRRRGHGGAVTGPESKQRVHELRDRQDAILIGISTALIDNPSLTTRLPDGGRDPLRVILDSHLQLSPEAEMLQQESKAATWIICGLLASGERQKRLERAGAVIHRVETDPEGHLELPQILQLLGRSDITSVLVEGGAMIHGSFLRASLVDQVFLFTAPYFVGDKGTPLVAGYSVAEQGMPVTLTDISTELVGHDLLVQGLVSHLG